MGAAVPATLSLTLGTAAAFGAFVPGVDREYTATTTASVVSTAGDATLSVADPSGVARGRLVNGAFALDDPLRAMATSTGGSGSGAFAPLGDGLALLRYAGPVSNDAVSIAFRQRITAGQAAAHRHLRQDADLHALDHDAVGRPGTRPGRPNQDPAARVRRAHVRRTHPPRLPRALHAAAGPLSLPAAIGPSASLHR